MSNQLFTAKGKYNLFFTLLRKKRFIYLRQSVEHPIFGNPTINCRAPPGSPVPINGFAFHVVGWTDSPSEKQTNWQRTWLFQKLGFWLLEVWKKMFIFLAFICPRGCDINWGRYLEASAFFPGRKNRHFAYGSHGTYPVGRKKIGNCRWTWYLPRFPHGMTMTGNMPLNHRRVFF